MFIDANTGWHFPVDSETVYSWPGAGRVFFPHFKAKRLDKAPSHSPRLHPQSHMDEYYPLVNGGMVGVAIL